LHIIFSNYTPHFTERQDRPGAHRGCPDDFREVGMLMMAEQDEGLGGLVG